MTAIDLFSGTGSATVGFLTCGWDVVTVDHDYRFGPTYTADVQYWKCPVPDPDFVWASPPCTEFSRESMVWYRTGEPPSMELVWAVARFIDRHNPPYWCVENVRGAVRHLDSLFGRFRVSWGPFFLWGVFPELELPAYHGHRKEKLHHPVDRAAIPLTIAQAMACAVTLDINSA
jgi:site-specific DNA-cytosine methylase